jgi:chromosome segregation ATPase
MKKICILVALMYAPAATAEFKCVDARGLTHIGDTPPAACADVVMYEISKSGRVLQKIDPTPTPEQVKQRQDEADRKKEQDRAAGEQKRKDLALLNTYSTEREVDVARDRNIEPLRGRIKSAQERMLVVEKRAKVVDEEMEFYKAGQAKTAVKGQDPTRREAPPALVQELERIRKEKESLTKGIAQHEKEIEALNAKYDQDKQRWLALKSGAVAKPAEYLPPQAKAIPDPPADPYYNNTRRRRY